MMISVMKSKIHGALVTEANLLYEGSITIDEELMEKSGMIENEKVQVVDLDNGERIETYVIKGKRGSREICTNGPAALKCSKGHHVHIISYGLVEQGESFSSQVLLLGDHNSIKQIKRS